jgi:RNA polymerase-binding transcription factor DksA
MSTATLPSRTQLRELERELRSERARLERAMGAGGWQHADATPRFGDARRTPANADGGLAVAVESRTLARHEALTEALRRLEAGTYGRCARCGKPIPYGRLVVMPEATHCLAC